MKLMPGDQISYKVFYLEMNKPLYFAWIAILLSCFVSSLLAVTWMILIKKKIQFD